jgi:hypothetical protein
MMKTPRNRPVYKARLTAIEQCGRCAEYRLSMGRSLMLVHIRAWLQKRNGYSARRTDSRII